MIWRRNICDVILWFLILTNNDLFTSQPPIAKFPQQQVIYFITIPGLIIKYYNIIHVYDNNITYDIKGIGISN